MGIYTFYLLDAAGAVRGFEFEPCDDDLSAGARAAEVLARHPDRFAVEVRRGDEIVYPRSGVSLSSTEASWRRARHR